MTSAKRKPTNKIAYIVPARLGDAVMTTSIAKLLKDYYPNAQIDILAPTSLAASVYANNPHICDILISDQITDWSSFEEQYDKAFITHTDRKTIAIGEKLKTEIICDHVVDHSIPQTEKGLNFVHHSHQNKLSESSMCYQLFPSSDDITYIANILKNQTNSNKPSMLVGCHLGCHGIAKKNGLRKFFKKRGHHKVWPIKYFQKLEKLIQCNHSNMRLVLTGSPNEINLSRKFMKNSNAINLVGKTSPLQLAALMPHLKAFISSDTGPMHVACSAEIPLIALFGPTNPLRTGPYPKTNFRHVLTEKKMSAIKPQQVYTKLLNLLEEFK